jgi:hypothetical protein
VILEAMLLLLALRPEQAAAGWVQLFPDGMLTGTTFSPATVQNVRLTMEFRCSLRCGALGLRSFPNQGFVVDLGASPSGVWNRLDVVARGSSLVARVDGKVIRSERAFRHRAGGVVLLPGVGGMDVRDARWKPLDMARLYPPDERSPWREAGAGRMESGLVFDDFVLQVDVKGGPANIIVRGQPGYPESGYRIPLSAGGAERVTYTVIVSGRNVHVWANGIPAAEHNPEPSAMRLGRGAISFQKDAGAAGAEFGNALLAPLPLIGER